MNFKELLTEMEVFDRSYMNRSKSDVVVGFWNDISTAGSLVVESHRASMLEVVEEKLFRYAASLPGDEADIFLNEGLFDVIDKITKAGQTAHTGMQKVGAKIGRAVVTGAKVGAEIGKIGAKVGARVASAGGKGLFATMPDQWQKMGMDVIEKVKQRLDAWKAKIQPVISKIAQGLKTTGSELAKIKEDVTPHVQKIIEMVMGKKELKDAANTLAGKNADTILAQVKNSFIEAIKGSKGSLVIGTANLLIGPYTGKAALDVTILVATVAVPMLFDVAINYYQKQPGKQEVVRVLQQSKATAMVELWY